MRTCSTYSGRQRGLNFPPGTQWSYSNSGYNLSAIIVSRVSGESFAEFTRKRIFEPLGMTRTSWRDDFTRIVKDRAVAYAESDGRYAQDMPFENVHGNGGLLTTVGDLLRWNENFVTPKVGDAGFIHLMQTSGMLGNGRETGYAYGLGACEPQGARRASATAARPAATAPTSPGFRKGMCPWRCCATPATACRDRRCTRLPIFTSPMR